MQLAGWVSRADVLELLRTAWAVVQPSTFEGFGMPVLEAMAAGVPLACSDIPPFREIAGDDAARFDPLDEGAIERALSQLLDAPPATAAARERARAFTWERAARQTIAALEKAAPAEP